MISFSGLKIILSLGLAHLVAAAYVNNYDGKVDFKCTKESQTISRVHSIHDNGAEDRIFEFECREIGLDTVGDTTQCAWSANWENPLDLALDFECPGNGYINGMISEHDNGAEDRRWKFNCCHLPNIHMYDCSLTPWTNDYDKPQDYRLPTDKVMKGVFGEHDNGSEDRRYRYEVCNARRFTDDSQVVG